tara:strand:+ start:293 stop:580 length:288 start_codon:yes stop_codon:yes gene_type:complete
MLEKSHFDELKQILSFLPEVQTKKKESAKKKDDIIEGDAHVHSGIVPLLEESHATPEWKRQTFIVSATLTLDAVVKLRDSGQLPTSKKKYKKNKG